MLKPHFVKWMSDLQESGVVWPSPWKPARICQDLRSARAIPGPGNSSASPSHRPTVPRHSQLPSHFFTEKPWAFHGTLYAKSARPEAGDIHSISLAMPLWPDRAMPCGYAAGQSLSRDRRAQKFLYALFIISSLFISFHLFSSLSTVHWIHWKRFRLRPRRHSRCASTTGQAALSERPVAENQGTTPL